jgi:hypothetical protein
MPTHIYHLVDPNTKTVKYVGKSTNPKSRLRSHIQESQESQNTEKKRWIKSLLNAGQQPVLVIVATYPDDTSARTRESAECKTHLQTILNIHDPAKGAKDFKKHTAKK